MYFKIHLKFIKHVEQTGSWIILHLTNGVKIEDKEKNFELIESYVIHY